MENNMEKALQYFQTMGIPIKDGYIDSNLTDEQIEILKKWRDNTMINGIMMPDEEDFYRSILLAISLQPQKDENGKIVYLFGKGIGVEVALRGTIEGRENDNIEVPYRSHSDFELYDVKKDEPYKRGFQEIYGSQEWYPTTETKGLKKIPEGYMDKTYETVVIDGYEVLVPQLEILFLDKFLKRESTPREEGYDCELLAQRYNLDINLIKQYLEKHYIKPMQEQKQTGGEKYKQNFTSGVIRNLKFEYESDDDNKAEYADQQFALEETIRGVNERVNIATKMDITVNGIRAKMFVPLTVDDVSMGENGEFILSDSYIKRTIENISKVTEREVNDTGVKTLQDLDEMFDRIDRQLGIDDYAGLAYDKETVGTTEQVVGIFEEDNTKEQEGGPSIDD